MALLTCVTATPAGPVTTGVAVASADTISGNDVANGAVLTVTTAATPTNVTFTDPGHTPAGSAAAAPSAVTVAANTSRSFGHLTNLIDPATNLVTVNYSATTNVTWQLVA